MPNSNSNPVGAICIPCLKKKLADAKPILRDNVAQHMISELSNAELAHLPAQLKQQLNEELTSGWVSDNDQFALQRLSEASKTAAIDILKQTNQLSEATKKFLSPQLIEGIYQAEGKRLSLLEKVGIDGDTIGRGQIGSAVYQDVMNQFKKDLTKAGYTGITGNYKQDLKNPILEDFTTAAALALKVENAQKLGRRAEDALKFGVGLYHGAFNTLSATQKAVGDTINYAPVEQALKSGNATQQDVAAYIDEVVNFLK